MYHVRMFYVECISIDFMDHSHHLSIFIAYTEDDALAGAEFNNTSIRSVLKINEKTGHLTVVPSDSILSGRPEHFMFVDKSNIANAGLGTFARVDIREFTDDEGSERVCFGATSGRVIKYGVEKDSCWDDIAGQTLRWLNALDEDGLVGPQGADVGVIVDMSDDYVDGGVLLRVNHSEDEPTVFFDDVGRAWPMMAEGRTVVKGGGSYYPKLVIPKGSELTCDYGDLAWTSSW